MQIEDARWAKSEGKLAEGLRQHGKASRGYDWFQSPLMTVQHKQADSRGCGRGDEPSSPVLTFLMEADSELVEWQGQVVSRDVACGRGWQRCGGTSIGAGMSGRYRVTVDEERTQDDNNLRAHHTVLAV